jgi:hypothetical protein
LLLVDPPSGSVRTTRSSSVTLSAVSGVVTMTSEAGSMPASDEMSVDVPTSVWSRISTAGVSPIQPTSSNVVASRRSIVSDASASAIAVRS